MRLTTIFFFICLSFFNFSSAQEYPSLEPDSLKIKAWLNRAVLLVEKDRDSALEYTKNAFGLAVASGYETGIAEASRLLGTNEMYQGNYSKANFYYEKAIKYYQKSGDLKKLSTLYSLEGINNGMQNKSAEALSWFLQAVKLSEQIEDRAAIADLNYKIGIVFGQVEDFDNALAYQYKSIKYAEELKDKRLLMAAYGNLGMLLGQQKDYSKALKALQQSKQLTLELNNLRNLPNVYLNLGNVYRETGLYDSSGTYLRGALGIFRQADYPVGIAGTSTALADLHFRLKQYDSAIGYINQSMELSSAIQDQGLLYENTLLLIRTYNAQGRHKDAAQLFESLMVLRDSADVRQSKATVERTRLGYEIEQKESSIKILESENQLKTQQRNLLLAGTAGSLLFTVLIAFSFFQIRKKNRQLNAQKEELQELNLVKDKLFSVISHDLRTPLSHVLGVLPLVQSQTLTPEEEQEMLANLQLSASATLETLDNLLFWGTSQLRKEETRPGPVDVKQVSAKAIELYNNVASQKSLKILNNTQDGCIAWFDKNQMEFIIRNLVANAIKFSYSGKAIEIRCAKRNDRIILEVEDMGTGMSEDALQNLFNARLRATEKGTSGESGVGLGLTLIHDFLSRNNGAILVTSRVGEGSCFMVDMPAAT